MPAGETRRVMDTVAPEAFTLAEAVSDRARASRASRLALGAIVRYGAGAMRRTPEYLQWVERADRYAEPGTTERVYTDLGLCGVRMVEGNYTEGRALALRAMELARKLEDPEAIYLAARELLVSACPPEHEEERLRLVREMSSHDQAGVTAATLGSWLQWGGLALMDWGDRAGAEAMWEQEGQLAQRTNDANLLVWSLTASPILAYLDGRLDEAVSGAEDILRTAEDLGAPVMGRQWASLTSWRPLLYLGKGEEALAALGGAAELAGAETLEVIERQRSLIQAHLGQTAEAREAVQGLVAEPRFGFEDENLPTFSLALLLETAI